MLDTQLSWSILLSASVLAFFYRSEKMGECECGGGGSTGLETGDRGSEGKRRLFRHTLHTPNVDKAVLRKSGSAHGGDDGE